MQMRIAINAKRIETPYGGGNQFANNLEDYLRARGHEVFRILAPNLDLILIVSSKSNIQTTSFPPAEAEEYAVLHPNTVIVQRINSCDEARGADLGINKATLEVNRFVDYTVFVSRFIRDMFIDNGFDSCKPHEVILTGVDTRIFNTEGRSIWSPGAKMRIVTHHWSSNFMKGFDFYERLDLHLERKPFRDLFDFCYIGNLPKGFSFKNAEVHKAQNIQELAVKLRENHVCVTGARGEAGGNHYIEAMLCGLPVLYLESGSSGEYCAPYGGVAFNQIDFENQLIFMRDNYCERSKMVLECPYKLEWMADQYLRLFDRLVDRRRESPGHGPGAVVRGKHLVRQIRRKVGRMMLKAIGALNRTDG